MNAVDTGIGKTRRWELAQKSAMTCLGSDLRNTSGPAAMNGRI